MGIAKSLPLPQLGEHFQLLGLLIEDGLPQEILLVGLPMLQVGKILILNSTLNSENLLKLLLIRKC